MFIQIVIIFLFIDLLPILGFTMFYLKLKRKLNPSNVISILCFSAILNE